MKESKAVYVTKSDLNGQNRCAYYSTLIVNPVHQSPPTIRNKIYTLKVDCRNVSCQCNINEEFPTWGGTSRRYFDLPRQIYFQASRSYTDIGVGSVRALHRRKVKRIYLPDQDDGVSDLCSFNRPAQHCKWSYYEHKRTSSKCVGSVIEENLSINQKLLPIAHKKSATTSPIISFHGKRNIEIGSNTIDKKLVTKSTQVEDALLEKPINKNVSNIEAMKVKQDNKVLQLNNTTETVKDVDQKYIDVLKENSTDSLIKQIYNLENTIDIKKSVNLMEKKLEKEYRKIFTGKSILKKPNIKQPSNDLKKESVLKRRFEALRRSLAKKECEKKSVVRKVSSKSIASLRDASINSDPSSLEARFYSSSKIYSPIQYFEQTQAGSSKTPYKTLLHVKENVNRSKDLELEAESECQRVEDMLKLWDKKVNLEEDSNRHSQTQLSSEMPKKVSIVKDQKNEKRDGRKYFFFKKKNKDNTAFKSKKNVTAEHCEVKDGLVIKMGANKYQSETEPKMRAETFSKTWIDKFLTSDFDSAKSLRVRWNNKTYRTKSSTVFALIDSFYKEADVFQSRSDIITSESSFFKTYSQQMQFFQQEVDTWMIPQLIIDKENASDNIQRDNGISIAEQKWIDRSKTLAGKIKVVLHSKNPVEIHNDDDSTFLRIDIPKGFFGDSGSGEDIKELSSDEEVYKVVEYEAECDLNKKETGIETGNKDNISFIFNVNEGQNANSKILETMINKSPKRRDAVTQSSEVHIPKRCGAISVGIITKRELSNAWKPIIEVYDGIESTDDESDPDVKQKTNKCEFAKNCFADYYRHWVPLEIDIFDWCISDSHLKGSNQISQTSYNQGDSSNTCPNIYDNFQYSTTNEPYLKCGPCHPHPPVCDQHPIIKEDNKEKSGFFKKLKRDKVKDDMGRVSPKDSLEVFKKRRIYACSNKSKWGVGYDCPEDKGNPYCDDKKESKEAKEGIGDSRVHKSHCKTNPTPKNKDCKKHVSMPHCDTITEVLAKQRAKKPESGILNFKSIANCEVCKKGSKNSKSALVTSIVSAIRGPGCESDCKSEKHPSCDQLPERCTPIKVPLRKKNLDDNTSCMSPSESQESRKMQGKCQNIQRNSSKSCKATQSSIFKSPPPKPFPNIMSPNSYCPPDKLRVPTSSKSECFKPSSDIQITPICPHFPPCMKTQSVQKSPTASVCMPQKKDSSQPHTKTCCKLSSPTQCRQCPGPIKNQEPEKKPMLPNQYDKRCVLIRQPAIKKEKECKPDCANRKKPPDTPQSQVKCKQNFQPNMNSSKEEYSGIYLKIIPTKTCSADCLMHNTPKKIGYDDNIQSNLTEDVAVTKKKTSTSTEEIRVCQNIKVKDADGNTLFERMDYKKDCSKPTVFGDLYKTSINRVSAPINIKNIACEVNKEDFEEIKETSVTNLIEIQFKLKVTTDTEANIGNDEAPEADKGRNSQIYVAEQNQYNLNGDSLNIHRPKSKDDVSIRIFIKNRNPKMETRKNYNETFSENIANKFQTVSTAYSNKSQTQVGENAFSVHRTTVDLSISEGKLVLNASKDFLVPQFTNSDTIKVIKSSQSACYYIQSEIKTVNESKAISEINIDKKDLTEEFRKETHKLVDENVDDDEFHTGDCIEYLKKPRNRKEKKETLKVFEKADESDVTDKTNKKELEDMLKFVLISDSSPNEAMAISNVLVKDTSVTHSMKLELKDTQSMNNYYQIDSLESYYSKVSLSDISVSLKGGSEARKGCMCNKFAKMLKLYNIGGGCCVRTKIDKEVICNLKREKDFLINKEYIDIETQHSKYTVNKINSAKISIHANKTSFTTDPLIAQVRTTRLNEEVTRIFFNRSFTKNIVRTPIENFNTNTSSISGDKIIFDCKGTNETESKHIGNEGEITKTINDLTCSQAGKILQSYETKKAVLEIYAEKILTEDGERIVAKLPKFIYNNDSDFDKFERIVERYKC